MWEHLKCSSSKSTPKLCFWKKKFWGKYMAPSVGHLRGLFWLCKWYYKCVHISAYILWYVYIYTCVCIGLCIYISIGYVLTIINLLNIRHVKNRSSLEMIVGNVCVKGPGSFGIDRWIPSEYSGKSFSSISRTVRCIAHFGVQKGCLVEHDCLIKVSEIFV